MSMVFAAGWCECALCSLSFAMYFSSVRRTLRSVHEDLELHEARVRVSRHPVRDHPRERDERPRLRPQVADVLRKNISLVLVL